MRSTRTGLTAFSATILIAAQASGAPTDAQKCAAAKMKAGGKYSLCRMAAEAKAVKNATAADFSKCDEKLTKAFVKQEATYGSACPTSGDVAAVRTRFEEVSSQASCAIRNPSSGASSSVVFVPNMSITPTNDATITLSNVIASPVVAYCFYVAECQTVDFFVPLGALESVSWSVNEGSASLRVPPLPNIWLGAFMGEMVCVAVDGESSTPHPIDGDHLIASIARPGECPADGVGFFATAFTNGDSVISFGPFSEYEACPVTYATRMQDCWSLSLLTFDCN